MRVLHVITGLSMGGAERALFNILSAGLGKRFSSQVVSLTDEGTYGDRIRKLGIPVNTLDMPRGVPSIAGMVALRSVVNGFQPELIQGWMYHGNIAATAASRMSNGVRPLVVWNVRHSLYSLNNERPMTKMVIRAHRWTSSGVSAVVYNSFLAKRQHEDRGFPERNACVIPNGFNTSNLRPDPVRRAEVRLRLGIPKQALVIGHVARFHPIKDHSGFLRAVVETMRVREDVVALMVGRDVVPENPVFRGLIPSDLMCRFRLVGEQENAPDSVMQAMDLFCISSISEAFPNVLGEAMALEIPCVVTDVGDCKDIVGEFGVVVPPSDHLAMTGALLDVLSWPSEYREEIGKSARKKVESDYSLGSVVEKYDRLYHSVMSSAVRSAI